MKTRHDHRVQNNRSSNARWTLLRWLSGAVTTLSGRYDARRLLCEQLERRYALHGMGWFDGSFEHNESRDLRNEYDNGAIAGSVRSYKFESTYSAESESAFAQSFSFGEATSNLDTNTSEEAEVDCDHRRGQGGMRAEAEGGSINWFRPQGPGASIGLHGPLSSNATKANANFDKPEDKLIDAGNASNAKPAGSNDSKPLQIGLGQVTSSSGGSVGFGNKGFDPPTTNGPFNASGGSSGVPASNTAVAQIADRLGSAATATKSTLVIAIDSLTSQNSNQHFNPEGKALLSADSSANRSTATPLQNTVKAETNSPTAPTTTNLRATSNLVSANVTASDSAEGGWLIHSSTLSSTQRTSRNVDANSTSLSDNQTDCLLEQLRSVIDKLASDRQTDRQDADSRLRGAIGNESIHDFASAARRHSSTSDGMLELAAATDELIPTAITTYGVEVQTGNQHRSQLLASLELNREFELAGQTVDTLHSVVDPSTRVDAGQQAALATLQWVDGDAMASESPDSGVTEGFVWQNALLPLSFLAVGGLLIASRKRFVQQKKS